MMFCYNFFFKRQNIINQIRARSTNKLGWKENKQGKLVVTQTSARTKIP